MIHRKSSEKRHTVWVYGDSTMNQICFVGPGQKGADSCPILQMNSSNKPGDTTYGAMPVKLQQHKATNWLPFGHNFSLTLALSHWRTPHDARLQPTSR